MNDIASQIRTDHAGDESSQSDSEPRGVVDHFFRHEYARMVASLTAKFGVRYWELVEDVVQSALQRALTSWSLKGIPENPSGWLHRVASNMALDAIRRDVRWQAMPDESALGVAAQDQLSSTFDEVRINDDQLRMIYVCCDPAVPAESKIALALKTLCGFGNREIARALLTTQASVAKRITRAKQKLRETGVEPSDLTEPALVDRLGDVQAVVYLLFNEGYSSTMTTS